MKEKLRQQVQSRASDLCEYCRLPQGSHPFPFGIDHIRPQFHHGPSIQENLALACFDCNTFKGTNVGGYDPTGETTDLLPLFNPRTQTWSEHFEWNGSRLVGKTPIGRTTVDVLRINLPDRLELRRVLMRQGSYPESR